MAGKALGGTAARQDKGAETQLATHGESGRRVVTIELAVVLLAPVAGVRGLHVALAWQEPMTVRKRVVGDGVLLWNTRRGNVQVVGDSPEWNVAVEERCGDCGEYWKDWTVLMLLQTVLGGSLLALTGICMPGVSP